MNKKPTVPGLNLSELRDLAYRVKPVVKANERLFFVKESDLTAPIAEQEKVLEADMLSLLGESEYEGETYADVLLQIPEAFAEKVSAFRILPGNRAAWYEGLLPEVMFCQEFIILGQKHIPSRSYRYGGPELRPVKA